MRVTTRLSVCALFLTLLLAAAPIAGAATKPVRGPRTRILPLAVVKALVDKYANKYGIPLQIAHNLVEIESKWRQTAVSRRGARGVMQLRPTTARGLRVNIHDTEQNIEGGMRYLRQQFDRFKKWELALAAYHSGPGKVVKYRGVPPKSRWYVKRILAGRTYPAPAQVIAAARQAAPKPQAQPVLRVAVAEKIPEPPLVVWRRVAAVTGESSTITTETVENGQLTGRVIELRLLDGDQQVRIAREFRLVDGVWTPVVAPMEAPDEHSDGNGEN